ITRVPEGTVAAKLVGNINALTIPDAVRAIVQLSPSEEGRRTLLEKSLLDLQANDPEKLASQLTIRASRIRALVEHLKGLEAALSDAEIAAVSNARNEGRRKGEEATRLRGATFPDGALTGTGAEPWQ